MPAMNPYNAARRRWVTPRLGFSGYGGSGLARFSDGSLALSGETQGLALDFMVPGGRVKVKDAGTPANNRTNVPFVEAGGTSWLTNSGTSPKLVVKADGNYGWADHNRFLNSGTPATQNVTLIIGATYTYDVVGSGSLVGSAGASGTATEGSPVTFVATTTTGTFTLSGSLTTMQINRGSSVLAYLPTTAAERYAVPQEYDSSTGRWYGLAEPASTNLCLRSQDFTTTWVNTNTDEPTTNNADPAGGTTADEIAATSTADQAFAIYQGFTGLTANNSTVCSVYLKAGIGATLAQLAWDSNGSGADGCFCNFNLSTGAKGTVTALAAGTATSSTITSFGNGWYRCDIVGRIAVGTVGRFTISIVDDIAATVFQAADLTDNDSIIAWQAQVQAAAGNASVVVTSPIPTFGVTVVRAADNVNVSTSKFPFANPCTAYISFLTKEPGRTNQWVWELLADSSNRAGVSGNSSAELLGLAVIGGSTVASLITTTLVANTIHQAALVIAINDYSASADGGAPVTGTSAGVPAAVTLTLGRRVAAQLLMGRIYKFVYVPRRVSDADLPTWRYVA
jgi:hypothetical protein